MSTLTIKTMAWRGVRVILVVAGAALHVDGASHILAILMDDYGWVGSHRARSSLSFTAVGLHQLAVEVHGVKCTTQALSIHRRPTLSCALSTTDSSITATTTCTIMATVCTAGFELTVIVCIDFRVRACAHNDQATFQA